MKYYPKTYEDISRTPSTNILSNIGSSLGTIDDLTQKFKDFYKDAHAQIFDLIIKQVWLENHFLYNGSRRSRRSGNGYTLDWAFSYFFRGQVGVTQKSLTTGYVFTSIPTYINDFFPDFMSHNPFEEPEYFKFPYKNISLDHLSFVYQCHNRLDLLKEAEEKVMNIKVFEDWAFNWVACYNDEMGEDIYMLIRHSFIPYIKKLK